jgi:hypothetical protein
VSVIRDDQIPTGSSVWRSSDLKVPPDLRGVWKNTLTGALEDAGETLSVARALESFPVGVFENSVL